MATLSGMPSLEDVLAFEQAQTQPRPQAALPPVIADFPEPPRRNLFAAGLSAGIDELQGLGGAAASALGQAVGLEGLQRWGAGVAARNAAEAQAAGRPDLEIAPWKEGGASVLPWLAYQATKQIPQVGATIAGAALMSPVAVPAGLARLGAAVPQILGGGRGLAAEAAQAAGQRYAANVLGAAAVGTPMGVGSLYGEALDRQREGGEAPTRGEALASIGLGPVYGALEAVQPAQLTRALQQGLKGGIATRVGKSVGIGMVTEAPTEALQTVLENTFRPDLSAAQKAERIVDAALTGGAVGGVFGSVGGIRSAKVSGTGATNDELKGNIDAAVAPPAPPTPKPEVGRLAGLDDTTLAANRARLEERAFLGEQSPNLTPELGAYRGEETRRAFGALDDQALAENLASVRARLEGGEINAGLTQRAQAVEAELARREALKARVPEQGLLFGEQDLTQAPATQTFPVEPNIPERPMQVRARELLGKEKLSKTDEKYIASIASEDDVALAVRIVNDAQAKNPTAIKLAEKSGLNKSVDQVDRQLAEITPLVEQAATDLSLAENSGRANPAELKKAQDTLVRAQARVEQLNTQRALLNAVQQAQALAAEQRAPSASPTPPGVRTEPTPQQLAARFVAPAPAPAPAPVTEVQGELPLTMGRQTIVPQPSPQTFEATSAFLKGAVGTTSDKQIEEIGRATIPDAVARISTIIGNKKPKGAVLTRLGRYFGLVDERNNPVDIPTAIANTERAIATLQQQYDVLPQFSPARQADVRRNLDNQSTVLTERLDALRAAQQVQAIDQTITAPGTPAEVQAQGRAARAQVTGQFPQPTIEAGLRNLPFPEPVQPTAAPRGEPIAPIPVVPTARPAPRVEPPPLPEPAPGRPPQNPEAKKAIETAQEGTQPADQLPRDAVQEAENVRSDAVSVISRLIGPDRAAAIKRLGLGFASFTHIKDFIARGLLSAQSLTNFGDAKQMETTIRERIAQPFELVRTAYEKLKSSVSYKLIPELMKYTEFNIDPRKTWEQHTWLQGSEDAEKFKRLVEQANEIYRTLKREKTADVYDDFALLNRAQRKMMLAESLYTSVRAQSTTANLPGFETDPALEFIRSSSTDQSAASVAAFWDRVLERQMKSVADYLKVDEDVKVARPESVSALLRQYNDINQQVKSLDEGVYFHLGRYGPYMFKAQLTPGKEDKNAPPAREAVRAFAKALDDAKITDVQVSEDTSQRNVVIRTDNIARLNQLVAIAQKLQKQGYVVPDSILYGERDKPVGNAIAGEQFSDFIEALKASPSFQELDKKVQDKVLDVQRNVWLSTLPENAVSRVMAQRDAKPGYSPDSIRNFAFRYNVGAAGLARMVSSRYTRAALADMQQQLNAAKNPETGRDPIATASVINELNAREGDYADPMTESGLERVRAISYAFYLGMSPAYVLTNLTQLGVLGWPELAKKGGFVNSYKAMVRATPIAFRIMREIFKQGRQVGAEKAAEATVTDAALASSQLPKDLREFIMEVVNTGMIDVGSAMRELGRIADNRTDSKTDKMLKYAGAMGYYSETFNRLVMAIAAKEIAGKQKIDPVNYAKDVIGESMLNYQTWHTARELGRMGRAGELTPVMTQFSQYSFQVMEKLYRETYDAFKAADPKDRDAARKFMGMHLAAVVTLAGTLGLPFASVAARAAEALVELFSDDDEPYDIKAQYRNFLASTFGKDIGEVIARGVPRAFGFDLSTRTGEQDLLPLTQLLTDRRKIEDVIDARAADMLGPGFDMGVSIMAGLREFSKGEYMKAMQSMVPVALKGPLKAYEMADKGYVDKTGRALPMEAGALDILSQALGFKPAEKAEYDEARLAQVVRKGELTRRASELRVNLAKAIESGDLEAQREALSKAREFDKTNPTFAVLPRIGSTITQRQKASAIAAGTGTPLGTDIRDPAALGLTSYANF